MIQIKASQRLIAAAVPTKQSVRSWLVKNYGFKPGRTDNDRFSASGVDSGVIKDPAKLKALFKALEAAGFKKYVKEDVTQYLQGPTDFRIVKGGHVTVYTNKNPPSPISG